MEMNDRNNALSFGDWIQRRRKALDLTQADLAQKVGCAVVTIKKIEHDERKPSRQLVELLADHLAIPAAVRGDFMRKARGSFITANESFSAALRIPPFLQQELPTVTNEEGAFCRARTGVSPPRE